MRRRVKIKAPAHRTAGVRAATAHRQHSNVLWVGLERLGTGRAQGCMVPCEALRRTVSLMSPAIRLIPRS